VSDHVPEAALDYEEIFRRGGRNFGDEDFALFKCPSCGRVYLLEYEVDTVYLDGTDLSQRAPVSGASFSCVKCGREIPRDQAWVGPTASPSFAVTWEELARSDWAWVVRAR
jgi:predicted RNA-binding Zn-ribbon protein involved in translation (DUF1610 family)